MCNAYIPNKEDPQIDVNQKSTQIALIIRDAWMGGWNFIKAGDVLGVSQYKDAVLSEYGFPL